MSILEQPPTRRDDDHPPSPIHDPEPAPRGFNVTAWSLQNPYAVYAFYLAVVVLAVLAVTSGALPRRMMPYVESPMVGVVTMAPGMSAQEIETYVSKPIEEKMTDLRGVRYIRSTSQDGLSIVSLEFPYGSDMRKATTDAQSLLTAAQADLPTANANLKSSWVLPIDPLNIPVLALSLTGDPARGWTPVSVRQFAENEGVRAFKQAADVQSVEVYGGQKHQLRVSVDRDKLVAYGYSILDVRDAIDKNSVAKSAGTLTAGGSETDLRLSHLAQGADAIESIPLGAKDGRIIYLRDVATVTDTPREQRSGYHFASRDGDKTNIEGINNDAVELAIVQNPAAGSQPVIADVLRRAVQLEQDHPGLHFHVAYDNAHFVDILFGNTLEELAVAVSLCGIVVFLFLKNGRATLISLITIPVSLAMAVLLMLRFGFSLNSSTLIGLLLAIGRLVDDSVIDLHAIERHLHMGKDAKTATIDGITEVRRAVAAATLMLVAALLPLVFCGGITQLMFVGLIYPIIFGLLASFLVSLTLTGVLAAKFFEAAHPGSFLATPLAERKGAEIEPRKIVPPLSEARNERNGEGGEAAKNERRDGRGLDSLDTAYERLVRVLLRNRFTVIAGALTVIIIGFGFYHFIGSEMMPLADVGQGYAVLEMQPGTSYARTAEATRQFEQILLRHPEIERVSTEIGSEPGGAYYTGYAMNQVNSATMMLTLSDKDARKQTIWQVIDAARSEALQTIPGIRRLQIKEMGSDVMASSEAPVQLLVTGDDPKILSHVAAQVEKIAEQTPGAYQVGTSWADEKPTYRLDIDARRAALLGLTPADVADQAYYAMGGGLADEFYRLPNVRQDTINIRYQGDQRRDVDDLMQMSIVGRNGERTPLKTLASVTPELSPTLIEHDGLRRSISVLAAYRKGGPPSMDLAMSILTKASSQVNFPPGYSLEMRGDMTQMMDSFARLLRGLEVSMLLIFLILVAQFRGFLAPLQMLLSVPLELAGVFFGLWAAHQAFSSVSILAVIVLTGMDITTAILLIDQIMRRRAEGGRTRDEAIALACRDRLRPILMTSLITILTMAPVAFVPKTGMDAYQPLGTVVVSGLLAGTLLSLIVIPVLHSLVDDLGLQWRRVRRPATLGVLLLLSLVSARPALAADPSPSSDDNSMPGMVMPPGSKMPMPHETEPPRDEGGLPIFVGRMSLSEAIALAQKQNYDVRDAVADADASRADARSANAMTRPSLATTTYAFSGSDANNALSSPNVAPTNILTVPSHPFADQNLILMVPLSTGGRLSAQSRAAAQSSDASDQSLLGVRRQASLTVTQFYVTALMHIKMVTAQQGQLVAQQEQLRQVQQKVTDGRLAPIDLLQEQAEEAQNQVDLAHTQNDADIAELDLKTALGLSQRSELETEGTLEQLAAQSYALPPDELTVTDLALAQRPEVAAADARAASARLQVTQARSAYAPQLYGVAMADGSIRSGGSNPSGYTVGLTASLPLLDGGQRRAEVSAAQARAERAAIDAQRARADVTREAIAAWLSVKAMLLEKTAADAGMTAAEEGFRLANLRYDAGKITTAERLASLAAMARARAQQAQANADLVISRAALTQALGTPE